MELKTIGIGKPEDVNCIIGQAHFIKTVEDLYEALVQAVPGIRFGVSFCEASGPCLIRHTGTDAELEKLYRLINEHPQVTLVYASADEHHNNAAALKELLDGTKKPPSSSGPAKTAAASGRVAKRRPS
jgi:hypothetical protein